ncbi:MAG: TrkH family potassium uptake protein [Nanohaloarchaea archaeon]|nr:TrkH family potassium uptake protein [Candidatus Nanohaloarchaea archaeon]
MRSSVIDDIVGSFLKIYSLVLLVPFFVGIYFMDSILTVTGFGLASLVSFTLGYGLSGSTKKPTVSEAMFATVLGWILAIILGAIPFMSHVPMIDAIFESSAGLTTTGISMVLEPSSLPQSLLFWRGFSQWIGGLGILTFFIAVVRESGGVTRRLYSAESHKTDSGSIRPSLKKSIVDLWKVYGFITVLFGAIYLGLDMSIFDSLMHVFSGISTGGFSTQASSIGGFSLGVQIATIPLMLLGGINFVLLYKLLKMDVRPLIGSSEFKMYVMIFLGVALMTSTELFVTGGNLVVSIFEGSFKSAAVISSTGYSTFSITSLSVALQVVFLAVMFVGGSLGSTSGGWKVFRLKTMYEALKVRLRGYKLPESAINKVKIDGEIVNNSTVRTISVLFFTWISMIFVSSVLVLVADGTSFMAALSGSISAAGNMGPVYMSGNEMLALSGFTKILWSFLMLAGRLEMLPLLAIFNRELFEGSK